MQNTEVKIDKPDKIAEYYNSLPKEMQEQFDNCTLDSDILYRLTLEQIAQEFANEA